MSVKIMSAVFECADLNPTQTLVMLALADHASDDGRNIYPGYARLVHKTRLDRSTVSRTMGDLIDGQWLIRERRSTPTKPARFAANLVKLGIGAAPPVGAVPVGTEHTPVGVVPPEPSLTIIETSGSHSERARGSGAAMPTELKAWRDKRRGHTTEEGT